MGSFNRMPEFGIFCTIRAVSRATITRFLSHEPYLTAVCLEKFDTKITLEKKQHDLLDYLCGNIENTIITIASLEFQLKKKMSNSVDGDDMGMEQDLTNIYSSYEEDDHEEEDSLTRFRDAFHQALDSDSQGYTTTTDDISSNLSKRTMQDMNAVGWASLSFKPLMGIDPNVRVQVLDSTRLLDRLYMGIYVVKEKKKELQRKLNDLLTDSKRREREEEDDVI